MIDVTLIGTGALQPLPGRALSSAAVTIAGRSLLLDCGEGTQAAAKAAGVSLMKIDAIALTHYHGDHTFGLPGLLQSMGMAGRTQKVTVFGPAGLKEEMQPFLTLCARLPFEVELVQLRERTAMQRFIPAWPQQAYMTPFEVEHRVAAQGYRIDLLRPGRFMPDAAKALGVPVDAWKQLQRGESVRMNGTLVEPHQVLGAARRGLSVAYTGDTAACESALEGARGADLLICDATYGEEEHGEQAAQYGHMTFAQAAQMAAQAQVKALWLTHYSPMIMQPQDYVSRAQRWFGAAVCGMDGMKTTLSFEE